MGAVIGRIIAGKLLEQVLKKAFLEKVVPLFVDQLISRIIGYFEEKKDAGKKQARK